MPGRITLMPFKALIAAAWAAAVLMGAPAEAARCTLSTTPVVFGGYNVFTAAPLDSTGTIVYSCNGGAKNITIEISRGQGQFAERMLTQGSEELVYNLYLDAARTVIWGNGNGVSEVYFEKNPPNHDDVVVPIYGRVPAQQDVSFGAYADNVTVTINF